jgi:hypothetical protein
MSSRPDELEESHLKKLFKISGEVLKGGKGKILGSSGKRVPGRFTGEERDCKSVIPAKAGIQEGWLGVAKQFFVFILQADETARFISA